MSNNKEIPEVKSLRWLANMFPYEENATDEATKLSNAIHVYCTAGANKLEEYAELLETVTKLHVKETLNGKIN